MTSPVVRTNPAAPADAARWPLVVGALWCFGTAAAVGVTLFGCGFGSLLGGVDSCPPPEVAAFPPVMAVGGIVLIILALAGRLGIAIGAVVLTPVAAGLAAIAAVFATLDILIEGSDPYGYVGGPRIQLVGFVILGLIPAFVLGAYCAGRGSRGRQPVSRRASIGAICAAVVIGIGASTIGFWINGPPQNPRVFTPSSAAYRVVLPRGFQAGGTYSYPLLVIVSVGGKFSLPSDVDWFDEREDYEIQMSVEEVTEEDTLVELDGYQRSVDESLGFRPSLDGQNLEVAGRPAIRRMYRTETAPRRIETTSTCAFLYGCAETTVEAWADRRFFLHYDGPAVRTVRVVTIADGRGWVLSMHAAPDRSDADELFATFVSTFQPVSR